MRCIKEIEGINYGDFPSKTDDHCSCACNRRHKREASFIVDGHPACVVCAYDALVGNLLEARYINKPQKAIEWLDRFVKRQAWYDAEDEFYLTERYMQRVFESIARIFPHLVMRDELTGCYAAGSKGRSDKSYFSFPSFTKTMS